MTKPAIYAGEQPFFLPFPARAECVPLLVAGCMRDLEPAFERALRELPPEPAFLIAWRHSELDEWHVIEHHARHHAEGESTWISRFVSEGFFGARTLELVEVDDLWHWSFNVAQTFAHLRPEGQ